MYYLDPEDYGEPEVTEICIGTSWTYLGGLFRKSKVDEDAPPAADLSYPAGSAPACREVSLVLNLAANADGVEDCVEIKFRAPHDRRDVVPVDASDR